MATENQKVVAAAGITGVLVWLLMRKPAAAEGVVKLNISTDFRYNVDITNEDTGSEVFSHTVYSDPMPVELAPGNYTEFISMPEVM